jgi:hypothetical protein
MTFIIRFTKCRNDKISFIFIIIIGIFCIYASWCTFLYVLSESGNNNLLFSRNNIETELLDWFLNPKLVVETMNIISTEGYHISYRSSEIFGININGILLWFLWIIEAGLILLGSWFFATLELRKKIFCENCKKWIKEYMNDHNHKISMKDQNLLKNAIEKNITKLSNLEIAKEGESQYFKINLHHCQECHNLSTIHVDLVKIKRNDKGEKKIHGESYSPVFILNKQEFSYFDNLISNHFV